MSDQQTISKHLDKSVIRLFLVVFLFSVSVFAYRYVQYKPCENVVFDAKAKEFRVGELITFVDYTDNAKTWEWKFGDSTDASTNKEPLHIFKKPGEYTVELMVNNICNSYKVVTIKEKQFVIDSTKLPKFNIPSDIKVGETLYVKDETENASTWEWNFGETATANSTKSRAKYVYKESGLKTISLIVNGDVKHIRNKKITVLPLEEKVNNPKRDITGTNRKIGQGIKYKPLDEIKKKDKNIKNKPKVVPFISESDFKNKLVLVSEKTINANAFKQYLCGDLNKPLIVNGKSTTFLVFCEKIKGKNLKIKELTIYRDKGSNCIKTITIKHRGLGLFK